MKKSCSKRGNICVLLSTVLILSGLFNLSGCRSHSAQPDKELCIQARYNALEYSLPDDEYGDVVFCNDYLIADCAEYSEEYEIALSKMYSNQPGEAVIDSYVPVGDDGSPVFPQEHIAIYNRDGQQTCCLEANSVLPSTHIRRNFAPNEDKGVWVLSTQIHPITGEVKYTSSLLQMDGGICETKELAFESFFYIDAYAYSTDGEHVIVGTNENGEEHLLSFSGNGRCIADYTLQECAVVDLIAHNDFVVLLYQNIKNESELYLLQIEKGGSLDKEATQIRSNLPITSVNLYSQAGKLYAYDSSALFQFNEEMSEVEQLMQWMDTDSTVRVEAVRVNQQDEFLMFGYSYVSNKPTLGILRPADVNLPPKKIIRVGGYEMEQSPAVMSLIYQANYSSTEYHYELVDYANAPKGDVRGALFLDIMDGNAPDIYIEQETKCIPFYDLANGGYLCNLSSFVESLPENEYYKDLVCIGQEVPYCVAAFVRPNALLGLSSEVGQYQWNYSEYKEFISNLEDGQQFQSVLTSEDLLYYSLFSCMDCFVDINSCNCTFDSDEFRELLEWARLCGVNEIEGNIYERMQKRELLITYTDQISFKNMICDELDLGEPISYVGFPSVGGDKISYFQDFTIGISSQSQYTDECMRFMKMAFDEDFQIENRQATNAVSKTAERKIAEREWKELTENYHLDDFDAYFEQYQSILSSVEAPVFGSFEIMKIIDEEVLAYFQGQKSVEKVQEVIQKRVKLYLQEQYG